MSEFLEDPVFYWLVWAIFTVAGTIIGWSLRANFPEKDVRRAFDRSEHDRSVLARLYTHIKHQHDLREADFKRASLELDNLRDRLAVLEHERAVHANAEQLSAARVEQAEANAAQIEAQWREVVGRDDVVLAHLNHRLVQMSLRLLREEVWSREGRKRLHRVTARVVPSHASRATTASSTT